MPIVTRRNGKPISPGSRGDIAVFDGHSVSGSLEQSLLLSPDMGNGHVEPVDSPVECVDEARQSGLEQLALSPFFCSHPIRKLPNHDRARVAAILFLFEPSNYVLVTVPLGRLADYIRIEQPAHSLLRRAGERRRGGTSSALMGHCLSTSNQRSFPESRRKTSASSSSSKRASK